MDTSLSKVNNSTTNKLSQDKIGLHETIIGACDKKFNKNSYRLSLINQYLNDEDRFSITFGDWLSKQGLDGRKYFAPISFVKQNEMYATHDPENNLIGYSESMTYANELGVLIPDSSMLSILDDKTKSSVIGIIDNGQYNKNFGSKSQDSFQEDFFALSTDDILNFSGKDVDGEFDMEEMKHFIENENDIVGEYKDGVINIREEMLSADSNYSNATGSYDDSNDRACVIRFPFNEQKRKECQKNKDIRKEEEKQQKKEEKEARKDAREEFRIDKKNCKDEYKKGNISYSEYRKCVKGEKIERKQTIKNDGGGSALSRIGHGINKFNPVTASTRAASLSLIKLNFLKLATKLVPAVTTNSDILNKFKPSAIENSKKAYKKALKAWKGMGGSKDGFDDAILKGWNKKEQKIDSKLSFDGDDDYSNAIGEEAWAALSVAFLGAVTAIVTAVTGKSKDMTLPNSGIDVGDENINSGIAKSAIDNGESPLLDDDGNWIDPVTGEKINPKTGDVVNESILGIPKWAFYTGIAILTIGSIVMIVKVSSKSRIHKK